MCVQIGLCMFAVFNHIPSTHYTTGIMDDFQTVYNALFDVRYKWRSIGLNLGIRLSDRNNGQCLEEVASK